MASTRQCQASRPQDGVAMIEVLVSLLILMVGILGLMGLMVQSQRAQVESYGRVQALLLVQDMASRINANKAAASCYVTSGLSPAYLGTGNSTVPASCVVSNGVAKARASQDLAEWRDALLGSAENVGTSKVGAILGARGCVEFDATTNIYQISIAWQGNSELGAPPAGVTCGTGAFGGESLRRAVSVTTQII